MNGQAVAALFERLEVAELQLRLRHQAWCDGFAAAERVHADDYDRGFADGVASFKRTEHELVDAEEKRATKWIVRGQRRTRQTFADLHPRDYPGGPLPVSHPGMVWLGGNAVHREHECRPACRSYRAGWYTPSAAAAILGRLPGSYADEIERLTAVAAEGGEAA